mmetsp:Transcript_11395/g.23821  ORF Transcript_11395/g.23821 Transcript_11395/m.23821 type:complete len:406 (+) Transcript_11395:273-1490(+)
MGHLGHEGHVDRGVHAAGGAAEGVHVDVLVQEVVRGQLALLGGLDGVVDDLALHLLHLLQLRRAETPQLNRQVARALHRVTLLADGGDLIASAVGAAGVGHGVTVVAVGVELEHDGALAGDAVLLRELQCLLHRQRAHAVGLEAGDVVAAGVVVVVLRRAPLRGAHAVVVVLAHVNQGQVPQRSHVERLEQLALVGSAITVHGDGHVGLLVVLVGEGQTRTQGGLSTNNTVAPVEVRVLLVHVHRATNALRCSAITAHQLSHDLVHGATTAKVGAVVTVRGDDGVFLVKSSLHANADGLLAVIQVAETADELALVQDIGSDLHAAEQVHSGEHVKKLALGGLDGGGRRVDLVRGEGDINLVGDGLLRGRGVPTLHVGGHGGERIASGEATEALASEVAERHVYLF